MKRICSYPLNCLKSWEVNFGSEIGRITKNNFLITEYHKSYSIIELKTFTLIY